MCAILKMRTKNVDGKKFILKPEKNIGIFRRKNKKTFLESKWGKYPEWCCSSKRTSQLRFISILLESDIATAVLGLGHPRPKELTLVFVDGQWYIAQEIDIVLFVR